MPDRFRNGEIVQASGRFIARVVAESKNIARVICIERTKVVRYDFKVKKCDETIVVMRSVALPDMDSIWSEVVALAQSLNEAGSRIVVTDEAGEIVVLVGVATASSLLNAPQDQKPALILRHFVGGDAQMDAPQLF
jgi:hypothetical protein